MRDLAWFVWLLPRNAGVVLIRAYRAVVSPLYGDVCRYYPSCSAYGLGAVQHRGLVVGSGLTAWRIVRCNPWSAGGIDDVPLPKVRRFHVTRFGFVIPAGWAGTAPTRGRHTRRSGRRRVGAPMPTSAPSAPRHDHTHDHDVVGPHLSPTTSRKD
ncbi:hypothetical protein GCM10009819_14980 [Agromyces tropicus]|uniref:Putative membrane protein insertion efficiency factor n=1 Tax=Agromyces tropicus TaxID=555371 RepID=A0ABN2U9P1_9MICO